MQRILLMKNCLLGIKDNFYFFYKKNKIKWEMKTYWVKNRDNDDKNLKYQTNLYE
jgi:hypothetical protein